MSYRDLIDAHTILYGEYLPPNIENWEIAKDIVGRLDDPRLPRDLALRCLSLIVLHTEYPSEDDVKSIFEAAEQVAVRLVPGLAVRDPSPRLAL